MTVLPDLVHTQVEGYRPLALDLYLPDGEARALCVYVHGGGWLRGSRRAGPGPVSPTSGRLLARMATAGLAVASVDYRLSGEATFPAQPEDVKAACRWLGADARVTGLPLVLFGVSAGGQVAALCGLDPAVGARAVACWYPVTDFLAMPDDVAACGGDADRGPSSREARVLGAPAAEVPDLARAASPVAQVHAAAPPFLLVHGDADRLVPTRQSERLHDALLACGVSSTFRPLAGCDHMLPGIPDTDLEALVDETVAFLLAKAETR